MPDSSNRRDATNNRRAAVRFPAFPLLAAAGAFEERTMSNHLSYASNLLRYIAAHDLRDKSVTIVDQATLPERFQPADSRIVAWTHSALDLALGCKTRGFACVMNVAAIASKAADVEGRIYGVAIHELAHWLALPEFLTCERHELALGRHADFDAYAAWARAHDFRRSRCSVVPEVRKMFAGHDEPPHGHQFLMAGLHLLYRARRIGFDISDDDCQLSGEQYGTSSAAEFRDAMGDSLRNCLNMPIRSVLRLPPEGALRKLIERDQQSLEYLVLNEEH
jgi:hypothetical protein